MSEITSKIADWLIKRDAYLWMEGNTKGYNKLVWEDAAQELLSIVTAQDIMQLIAHKLNMEDKMLALVEVDEWYCWCGDCRNKYFIVGSSDVEKEKALIVYNGGGE